jgi:hypothetical protein
MGHSSPKVTLSHYSSVIKEEQALFDDRLFSVSIDVSTSVSNEKKALKIG